MLLLDLHGAVLMMLVMVRRSPGQSNERVPSTLYSQTVLQNRPCIAFIHVPKCAGTGFMTGAVRLTNGDAQDTSDAAALWFPGKLCGYYPGTDALPTACARRSWNSPGCGSEPHGGTHCGFSETMGCLKRGLAQTPKGWYATGNDSSSNGLSTRSEVGACTKLVFASVAREPVDRLISEYFWWGKHCEREAAWSEELCKTAHQGRGFADMGTVMDWLQSPHNNAANRMTKMFATYDGAPLPTSQNCIAFDAKLQYDYWSKRYRKTNEDGLEAAINSDDALLVDAIANVDRHFGFIGIQNYMLDSFSLFSRLLGQGPGAPNSAMNKTAGGGDHSRTHASSSQGGKKMARTKSQVSASPEFLAEAAARNRLDVELFRYIASRFNKSFHDAFGRLPTR